MTRAIRLEVCVDTAEGLDIATKHGADRIELCASLSVGGLTPSVGMMHLAAQSQCLTRAMVRPREGDFVYDDVEVTLMMHDIDAVAAVGLNGVVLGANRATGELDERVLGKLIEHAKLAGLQITLHRAFDVAPDLPAALTMAQSLGIDSILTSGGAVNALQGAETIRRLVQLAGASPSTRGIELMAGVGVSATTAPEIVTRSGVRWLHGSCSMPRSIDSSDAARLGYSLPTHRRTDAGAIDQLRDVLGHLARDAVAID
ncbi:hypothetical protein AEAC466_16715 [Asticcacaulis sp. AC466]|uniref:copper homeostasis protein CutC n=1 Tax=Asticcacaulis sp. AC466 TaxID=1282362 RepID=UPI0003C3DEED|nr:copper homeostasis protein CutC [Asticcacaulis sp. AC466]ESQ82507.1 hypothetical protein AEAC466_16715 [Asticcacaulis sp. AC466]